MVEQENTIDTFHSQDKDVVSLEEAKISEQAEPHEEVACAKQEAADVPHVTDDGLGLDHLLDDGPDDDEAVVGGDHHVPDDSLLLK